MIRRPKAEKRALVVALLIAAIACGSAAAAVIPVYWANLHARLAPVAGTTHAGRFAGTLLVRFGETDPAEPSDPAPPGHSQLTWKLSLPALHGAMSALLRIRATKDAAAVSRTLCASCSTTANGTLNLTVDQGMRIASSGAVIVVRTASATLRGPVKVSPQFVAQSAR